MDTVNSIQLPIASAVVNGSQTPQNTAEEKKTQFLQLLVAQLKGQNPLDPKDGTEFIAQLTQFSSLEELINIRTALEDFITSSTTTSASNPLTGNKE